VLAERDLFFYPLELGISQEEILMWLNNQKLIPIYTNKCTKLTISFIESKINVLLLIPYISSISPSYVSWVHNGVSKSTFLSMSNKQSI
jgi:hypothetical protein